MKKYILPVTLIILSATTFFSCKKDDETEVSSTGSVHVMVSNEVDGQEIQLGSLTYVNAMSNTYSIDLLRYYISNITFIQPNGTAFNIKNYDLIDAADSTSGIIHFSGIPNGTYSTMRFFIGVDSVTNYSIDNSGDLDPSYGMFWPWNTGYIFYKHEGFFIDSTGTTQTLFFHLGTDAALSQVDIPCNFTIDNNTRSIELSFNLNSAYDSPNPIDFNQDNYRQSVAGDRNWIEAMRLNLTDAFEITSVK